MKKTTLIFASLSVISFLIVICCGLAIDNRRLRRNLQHAEESIDYQRDYMERKEQSFQQRWSKVMEACTAKGAR